MILKYRFYDKNGKGHFDVSPLAWNQARDNLDQRTFIYLEAKKLGLDLNLSAYEEVYVAG